MNQLSDRENSATESLADLALSKEQADKTKGGTSDRSGFNDIIIGAGPGAPGGHVR